MTHAAKGASESGRPHRHLRAAAAPNLPTSTFAAISAYTMGRMATGPLVNHARATADQKIALNTVPLLPLLSSRISVLDHHARRSHSVSSISGRARYPSL